MNRDLLLQLWRKPVRCRGVELTLEHRFWDKVYCDPNTGCFLWYGATDGSGYGCIGVRSEGRTVILSSHRVSYLIHRGELGELDACHSCDTPPCVNPDHLWPGTHQDNCDDAWMKNRYPTGEEASGAKLTKEQVREILSSVERSSVMAAKFGVSYQQIWHIRAGRSRWL